MTNTPESLKSQLRRTLRQRRRGLDPARQAVAARAAAGALPQLPDWPLCRHIGLYLPADGELDTGDIARRCRSGERALYLPRVGARGEMQFALWREGAVLRPNRYGIAEPGVDAPVRAVAKLDLLFLPLVGWDRDGNRLGMGGGYYDRALAAARPRLLVGLAHGIQELEQIPAQPWDVRLDYVLTESGLHRCGPRDE